MAGRHLKRCFFWSRKETNNKRSASHGPNRSLTSLLSRALPSPGYHVSKQLKDMTDMAPYSASLCTVFCYRVLLVHFWLMQNLAQHSLAAPHVTPRCRQSRPGEINESNKMGSRGQLAETFAELQKVGAPRDSYKYFRGKGRETRRDGHVLVPQERLFDITCEYLWESSQTRWMRI